MSLCCDSFPVRKYKDGYGEESCSPRVKDMGQASRGQAEVIDNT